ncbi:threonine aldolase family protein [Litorisediminicola beolgyonensis]|uniref:Threonine aldolase family protein n=1 Tax=Litorisediminicola beolgyonensis TaxID=1173614 RepID=A0ABW3ZDT7_9RHOB
MFFASDNGGPVPPQVLDALARANEGYASAYGADDITLRVTQKIRTLFEAPEAAVHLVATGTAANSLALATLCQPFQTVFCTPVAHIHEDECNAPEFYTGGAKLTLVPGGDLMSPEALEEAILSEEVRGVHGPQRGPVSITQATEKGSVYSLAQIAALSAVAHRYGLPVQLDGARFANACAALGCTPAEMTWKSGVDVAVFGGTKCGLMGVEAVIFFDPAKSWEFELRRKRGGHLFSKHRYLAAQIEALIDGDLWRDLAQRANARRARLQAGLETVADILGTPQANILFARLPRGTHRRLQEAGARYYLWDGTLEGPDDAPITARFVCDWSLPEAEIDRFIALLND